MHVSMFPRPQTKALMAAMTVQPPSGRDTRAYDRFYRGLVALGRLATLDMGYLIAAHHEQAGRLNFKEPGTRTLAAVNSPTFAAYRGFAGDGATSYLDTAVAPNALTHFKQDGAHIGVYIVAGGNGGPSIGVADTNARVLLYADTVSPQGRVNTLTSTTTAAASTVGHVVAARDNSATQRVIKDGVLLSESAATSTAPHASALTIGRFNTQYSTAPHGAAHFGGNMSDAQSAEFYGTLQTYMRDIGAVT